MENRRNNYRIHFLSKGQTLRIDCLPQSPNSYADYVPDGSEKKREFLNFLFLSYGNHEDIIYEPRDNCYVIGTLDEKAEECEDILHFEEIVDARLCSDLDDACLAAADRPRILSEKCYRDLCSAIGVGCVWLPKGIYPLHSQWEVIIPIGEENAHGEEGWFVTSKGYLDNLFNTLAKVRRFEKKTGHRLTNRKR